MVEKNVKEISWPVIENIAEELPTLDKLSKGVACKTASSPKVLRSLSSLLRMSLPLNSARAPRPFLRLK